MNPEHTGKPSWRARARTTALSVALIALFAATVLLGSHGPQRGVYIDVERSAGSILAITLILRRIPND